MALHPGEFLMERIFVPSGVSSRRAAALLGISSESLGAVICGETPITPPLARALAREFCYSPEWWLDL